MEMMLRSHKQQIGIQQGGLRGVDHAVEAGEGEGGFQTGRTRFPKDSAEAPHGHIPHCVYCAVPIQL